jgi:hypothetical protein
MTNPDDIEQASDTLDGTRDKNEAATRALNDASEQAVQNVGAGQRAEAQRDDLAEDYEKSMQGFQSYLDQQGNALADIGANLTALYRQVLMDRRTFLAALGATVLGGSLFADRANTLPGDGSYDGGKEEPTGDWDAWGTGLWGDGDEQFESHTAADGSSGTSEYEVMEGTIDRGAYEQIFPNIVQDDRRVAQEIMGPDAFDRYFDGEATEFAEMNVNYDPDPEADNSSIEIGLVQADEVDDLSDIPEEQISYSLTHVSDRAAQTLIQELEAYQNQRGY